MELILIVLGIIIVSPLAYIEGFLLIELPKKIGRLKFYGILIIYITVIIIAVMLLSLGYLKLWSFAILILSINLLGVLYLRKEFVISLREDFNKLKRIFRISIKK